MSRQQDQWNQQRIGRYEVGMHGVDVAVFHRSLERIWTLKPSEALMLLEWLTHHQEALYQAVKREEAGVNT